MRKVPRLGPYRVAQTIATTADGRVFRAYNTNTDAEVLVITADTERAAAQLGERLARSEADPAARPIEQHLGQLPAWLVLPPHTAEVAVGLIGLAEVPRQNWFAATWGWPHYYPKTLRQLGFRCLCTVVGMTALFWVFWLATGR